MKDIAIFVAITIGAYIASMGVLYLAFRIFFPVAVEKTALKRSSSLKNSIKSTSKVGRKVTSIRLYKVRLAHG